MMNAGSPSEAPPVLQRRTRGPAAFVIGDVAIAALTKYPLSGRNGYNSRWPRRFLHRPGSLISRNYLGPMNSRRRWDNHGRPGPA